MSAITKILKPIVEVIKEFKRGPITFSFPPKPNLTEEFRGRHIFYPDKCIGCGLCEKVCPNHAITMVERQKDDKKIKYPAIDYSKCCFCGLCADTCPRDALKMTNFPFIIAMDKTQLNYSPEKLAEEPKLEHHGPPPIKDVSHWALSRSIWLLNYMTGCCFIEAIPWVSSAFDMERFGIKAVASPRHADAILVGGYVTKKTLKNIIRAYEEMPEPKFVLALGNCPMTGGTYWDSYNTIKDISKYVPVDIWIAGCPPRPENIGLAIMEAIHAIQSGYDRKKPKKQKTKINSYVPKTNKDMIEVRIPMGPVHPATGNFSIYLKITGETIEKSIPNPGFLHRGFEKLMEYRTWWQNMMLVPRICVLDGASYELSYFGAVEKVANIEAPPRAKYLRVIQGELSRIQSHMLNLGLIAKAAGIDTATRIIWGDREKILYLLEKLSGGRVYQLYNIPGGVRNDISSSFIESAREVFKYLRERLKVYDNLLFNNQTFIDRTKNIGIIPKKDIDVYDITGPNARASGVSFDIRKDYPYEAYDELDLSVQCDNNGDAYARTLVRRNEMEESMRIIEEALSNMPSGNIRTEKTKNGVKITLFSRFPPGEAIHIIESARGELLFHVISSGKNKPYRVK
ncbi:MAG: NADH-quinone oxidoreductase subunit NuoB, partial [Candidatus Njordarchaeota archaeon]